MKETMVPKRNILIDIRNKMVQSNSQNLIIKPDDGQDRSKSVNIDINRNELIASNTPKLTQPDHDFNDRNDPFFVTDYVKEIFDYMLKLEKMYRISRSFLDTSTHSLIRARSRLINSIIKIQIKFNMRQEVLFEMTQIIDRYLDKVPVEESELILLSATAFFIASKYDSRSTLNLSTINKMTTSVFTRNDIRRMEVKILNKLDFSLSKPTPLMFLRRFSRIASVKNEEHLLAKYFLEISILDFAFSTMDPSYLAASALCLSFKLLKNYQWNSALESNSTYTLKDLKLGMQKLAQMVLNVDQEEYEFKESWKKFSDPKFLSLSSIPELRGITIRSIASGSE